MEQEAWVLYFASILYQASSIETSVEFLLSPEELRRASVCFVLVFDLGISFQYESEKISWGISRSTSRRKSVWLPVRDNFPLTNIPLFRQCTSVFANEDRDRALHNFAQMHKLRETLEC